MSVGIVKFQKDLSALADQLDIELATLTKRVTLTAFNMITELTPVDTGRARASWAIGVGSPSAFVPPEASPAELAAHETGVPIFSPPDTPYAELALIDGKQPAYITSNLVYMEALEEGHSKQAPAGMVRLTVAALEIAFA